jgi:hypothetical protein
LLLTYQGLFYLKLSRNDNNIEEEEKLIPEGTSVTVEFTGKLTIKPYPAGYDK